ncbi:MAG: fumarate reductase/succinate dehydrogenase flavoprotein subunit, partial [Acidobacteriaceae bacterium]|nr:fumarate reductase/succinate dehydrogenase flavoprotein subunit [Acidobacteriaceae bacterium]
GLHGANRLGGNSLSDLVVFGRRAGRYAAEFARNSPAAAIDDGQIESVTKTALAPFDRGLGAENPYQIQYDLQDTMQDLVGIVRTEPEMEQALHKIAQLNTRAAQAGIGGNRQYNNGWHTAMDLSSMLIVSEAITRAAILRKESRGAQFREDYPNKDAEWGKHNIIVTRGKDGEMLIEKRPLPPIPGELQAIIEEMK